MLMTKGIEDKEANYFSNNIKYGFYKNKILFDFILTNEKNYFANCKSYKYYKNIFRIIFRVCMIFIWLNK